MDTNYGGAQSSTQPNNVDQGGYQSNYGSSVREEAQEIFSHRIRGRKRVYFVDLKQSRNGKFVKISEKSNGQKRTILLDQEDFDEFFVALAQVDELLKQ